MEGEDGEVAQWSGVSHPAGSSFTLKWFLHPDLLLSETYFFALLSGKGNLAQAEMG